jgi:hypothetical protein
LGDLLSRALFNKDPAALDRLRTVSGSRRESVVREAFKDLLKRCGRTHGLLFVPKHAITTPQKSRIHIDGHCSARCVSRSATGKPTTRTGVSEGHSESGRAGAMHDHDKTS